MNERDTEQVLSMFLAGGYDITKNEDDADVILINTCSVREKAELKALANLVTYLGLKTLDKGIQILTVSNPQMYGEYKPYRFVSSEKEFIDKVLSM